MNSLEITYRGKKFLLSILKHTVSTTNIAELESWNDELVYQIDIEAELVDCDSTNLVLSELAKEVAPANCSTCKFESDNSSSNCFGCGKDHSLWVAK